MLGKRFHSLGGTRKFPPKTFPPSAPAGRDATHGSCTWQSKRRPVEEGTLGVALANHSRRTPTATDMPLVSRMRTIGKQGKVRATTSCNSKPITYKSPINKYAEKYDIWLMGTNHFMEYANKCNSWLMGATIPWNMQQGCIHKEYHIPCMIVREPGVVQSLPHGVHHLFQGALCVNCYPKTHIHASRRRAQQIEADEIGQRMHVAAEFQPIRWYCPHRNMHQRSTAEPLELLDVEIIINLSGPRLVFEQRS